MAQYFDKDTRSIKRQTYTWADADGTSGNRWEDLTSWETGTGSYYTLQSGDAISFLTDIKDFGRNAHINPTCVADVIGDNKRIEVFVAESIDSSSQISGVPALDVSSANQTLTGTYGRYFQFRISVEDSSTQLAEILAIRTDLLNVLQQEGVTGNSSDHAGTQAVRILPLTKEYSKLASVVGNAEAVGASRPWVTVGSIGDPTTPRYTLFEFELDAQDSSTQVPGIKDEVNDTTITTSGAVESTNTEAFYKWEPNGIIFNTDSSDNDAHIEFDPTGLGTGDFEIRLWIKFPNEAHPDHFFKLTAGSDNIKFKSRTVGTVQAISYSVNGASYTDVTQPPGKTDDDWYHMAFWRSSGVMRVAFHHHNTNTTIGTYNWDLSSCTIELGDLGTGTTAFVCMDDIAVKSASQYTTSYSGSPGAEEVQTSDHVFLANGTITSETVLVGQNIVATDAPVTFHVAGLPKLISDSNGDIVEEAQ